MAADVGRSQKLVTQETARTRPPRRYSCSDNQPCQPPLLPEILSWENKTRGIIYWSDLPATTAGSAACMPFLRLCHAAENSHGKCPQYSAIWYNLYNSLFFMKWRGSLCSLSLTFVFLAKSRPKASKRNPAQNNPDHAGG